MVLTNEERDYRRKMREMRCRDRFNTWLQSNVFRYPETPQIGWEYEPCGHDKPPDFLLTLNDKQFAVEVTIIPHKEIVLGKPHPEEEVTSAMANIVAETRQECQSRGLLTGLYSVHFTRGIADLGKGKTKRNIVKQLLKYVVETQADYEAPKLPILVGSAEVCTIVKPHNVVDSIVLARSIDRTGGVPLCELARGAIDKKASSLRGIVLPHILTLPRILLLDADDRSEPPADWRNCLASHSSVSEFHSIVVVPGIQFVFAICVGEPNWPLI